MRVLCVCVNGQFRSKYLAHYLAEKGYTTDYGGSSPTAVNPMTQEDVDAADVVVTLNKKSNRYFLERFKAKKVIALDVEYLVFGPNIEKRIRDQIEEHLPF